MPASGSGFNYPTKSILDFTNEEIYELIDCVHDDPDLWPINSYNLIMGYDRSVADRCRSSLLQIQYKMGLAISVNTYKTIFHNELFVQYHEQLSCNWDDFYHYLFHRRDILFKIFDGYTYYEKTLSRRYSMNATDLCLKLIDIVENEPELWPVISTPFKPNIVLQLLLKRPPSFWMQVHYNVDQKLFEVIRMQIERDVNEQFFWNDCVWKDTTHYLYDRRHVLMKIFNVDLTEKTQTDDDNCGTATDTDDETDEGMDNDELIIIEPDIPVIEIPDDDVEMLNNGIQSDSTSSKCLNEKNKINTLPVIEKIQNMNPAKILKLIDSIKEQPAMWPINWCNSKNKRNKQNFRLLCTTTLNSIRRKIGFIIGYKMFKMVLSNVCQSYLSQVSKGWSNKAHYLYSRKEILHDMFGGYSHYERARSSYYTARKTHILELIDMVIPQKDLWPIITTPFKPSIANKIFESTSQDLWKQLNFVVDPITLEVIRMRIERECNEQFFWNGNVWKDENHYLYTRRRELLRMRGINNIDFTEPENNNDRELVGNIKIEQKTESIVENSKSHYLDHSEFKKEKISDESELDDDLILVKNDMKCTLQMDDRYQLVNDEVEVEIFTKLLNRKLMKLDHKRCKNLMHEINNLVFERSQI